MTITVRDLILAKKKNIDDKFEDTRDIFRGKITSVANGLGISSPNVEGRPGFIWVLSEFGNIYQVFNRVVRVIEGLEVLVGRQPKHPERFEVLKWNDDIIVDNPNYNGSPLFKQHGEDHEEWDGDHGGDPITVYGRMLAPLKTYVNEDVSPVNLTDRINVGSLLWINESEFVGYPGQTGIDISSFLPLPGQKKYILVYLDKELNRVGLASGASVANLPSIFVPYPAPPSASIIPSSLILTDDPNGISNEDIIDARIIVNSSDTLPSATKVGQVLFSIDGEIFTRQLPLTSSAGWLVNEQGTLLVNDLRG